MEELIHTIFSLTLFSHHVQYNLFAFLSSFYPIFMELGNNTLQFSNICVASCGTDFIMKRETLCYS